VNPPRSAFGAPPQGGAAGGPAKPDPRRLPGHGVGGLWAPVLRRLARDASAWVAMLVLLAIVALALAAPWYAVQVARTDPFTSNISGEVEIDGAKRAIIEASTEGLGLGQTPIGPTGRAQYLLGADNQGRDVAARLLYGGRASLLIAGAATLLCLALGALLGITAGFFGGWIDAVLSHSLDVLWAFPVYLLAISLSIVTIGSGLHLGPLVIESDNLMLPAFIIGLVAVPYAARPVRAQVLALRKSEFVQAAIVLGVPTQRILRVDVLPNVMPSLLVAAPLLMALNMLTESALSFLSIGVQPPNASWGSIIQDGLSLLYTRPVVALAPGVAIVFTVLALNLLGDALRDAMDPKLALRPAA
jgi:peptide/nickel transport system permease protein